ncbi:uncharacterized protein LOC132169717 [Corylus avellana]|uniref:uncharacterized protein LOC132169717 n=1 Tax=Corylus avellana TaxID=13451 RepID=UPI00286BC456|nr:uncharacterized protein LOC132169717 [Corylus avellana]
MEDSLRSGGQSGLVVKNRNSSGCLIVRKKTADGVEGVGSSSSRNVSESKKKKRLRLVMSNLGSSEELSLAPRRRLGPETVRVCRRITLSTQKKILITVTWCKTNSIQGLSISFGDDPSTVAFRLNLMEEARKQIDGIRKRTGNVMVISLIWLAYLLADWTANFAVGLISNSQKYSGKPDDRSDLMAFWAPFLLLHLGGPDTITAFALEDNALWLRHLVGLVTQVSTAFIVFNQSLPRNKLWIPTLLLFVAGTIKYCERTRALFLANLNQFRESILNPPYTGPNYAKLMEIYTSNKAAKVPIQIELIPTTTIKQSEKQRYGLDEDELDELKVVKYAYVFFEIFKGLIVDLNSNLDVRHMSREFIHKRNSTDAFKVLAVELNFMYDVLYTKVVVVHSKFGHFVRFISLSAVVAALSTFYLLDKKGFHKIDVGITYTLLFGAISLDTIAFFMLAFSDWTSASIQNSSRDSKCTATIKKLLCILLKSFLKRRNCWTDRRILFRRWSQSLHVYNLMDYCLEERSKKKTSCCDYFGLGLIRVINKLGLKDFYDRMKHVSKKPLTEKIWDSIFDQLKMKSNFADDPDIAKRICSARGDWVLQDSGWNHDDSKKILSYVVDVDYDESLIIWHIATDICYSTIATNEDSADALEHREFCNILSDYMLYLLVMEPTMMSAVGGIGQIRFRDTCAEAKDFFKRKDIGKREPKIEQKRAYYEMILEVNTDVRPVDLKGDKSKSVLFDASILAKELRNLEGEKRWKLMSKVWVELLSYAANHCKANTHAAQLSKGGELVTFVWLLMAHFGIRDLYYTKEAPSTKLIVGK